MTTNATRTAVFDSLEPRRLFAAAHALGINFVDEALFEENFSTSLAHAKALGVTAVRMWLGFETLADRPNAWDPVYPYGTVNPDDDSPEPLVNQVGVVMKRAFQLHDAGMSVLLILNDRQGDAPESAEAVRGFITHLMNSPEHIGGTRALKDVVDYWQIGNEVDSSLYWKPSASNKTTGIRRYVNELLIPAAEALKTNANETVVSSSVSWNPSDLQTLLAEAATTGKSGLVDYAGYHPYGTYDPTTSSENQIAARTSAAVAIGNSYGKELIATEWNIRGFGTTGANDTKWASALDDIYRETILPNYHVAFYFSLINNWSARGGTVSARPAGLLRHVSPVQVTPDSSVEDLRTYYTSPLVPAEPFYSTFKRWQPAPVTGSISGVLFNDTNANGVQDAGEGRTGVRTVYIDSNRNRRIDAGEPSVSSDAQGAYQFSKLSPGTYYVTRVFPKGYRLSNNADGDLAVNVAQGQAVTDVNIGTTDKPATPPIDLATASISGFLWNDTNANGVVDPGESRTGARDVFLDANRNGKRDAGETLVKSNANGEYTFSKLAAGTHHVSRAFPSGWRMSNAPDGYLTVTVTAGQRVEGVDIGTTNKPMVAPPPPPPPVPGTVSGNLFYDDDADGTWDTGESWQAGKLVYLDANNNKTLDAGEMTTTSGYLGVFKFTSVQPGTYAVRRVLGAPYVPTTPVPIITLGSAANITGLLIGTGEPRPVV